MRRRGMRPILPLLMIPLLLTAAFPPALLAQEPPEAAPPGAAPPVVAAPPAEAPPAEAPPGVEVTALSLEDCLRQALQNNLDIAVRRYDPLRSETQVTLNQSAFDPSLAGSATNTSDQQKRVFTFPAAVVSSSSDKFRGYTLGFLDPLTTGGNYRIDLAASDDRLNSFNSLFGGTSSTGFNTSWQVTFNQPLLRNLGRTANRWLIVTARNNKDQSESRFRQTVIETLAAAEKAYWDLNFALMDLKTKRTSLQLAKDFLDQNQIKVRVGTLAPIEITQAEAGVADREEGVIIAENAVRTAEDALRRIMNVPKDSPLWSRAIQPSDAPPLNEAKPDIEEAVTLAETKRPDLEQARLDVRNRETELQYRRNQRRWGLDAQGVYGVTGFDQNGYGDSYQDLRDRNQDSWKVAVNLSVPIGNRQAIANFTNAEYGVSQARYTLMGLEQAARVEVRNAVRAVETNLKRVKSAQVNVRLQREKLSAEQKKFENGMSTSFQILSFQNDLASAESRENQAIVDYNKSLVELERVKGTLLEAKKVAVPETDAAATRAALALPGVGSGTATALTFGDTPGEEKSDHVSLPGRFVWVGRRLVGVKAAETQDEAGPAVFLASGGR